MIITQTPLRISLLGGNTDFPEYFMQYGGKVITATIDKYIYCIVKERFDDQIWVNYSEKEIVDKVDDIKHDLVRESLKALEITKGIEITFLSDIPSEGTGLGSSSAVLVGLLNALHQFKNDPISQYELAKEACYIEIDILKKPIGYQDQYAVTYGGLKSFSFYEDYSVGVTDLNLFDEKELMLFYTGITRKSEDILTNMKLDAEILNKNKLLVESALVKPDLLGHYLDAYWELKKQLNPKTSNRDIDDAYRTALNFGANGGKIVGAGGGGFLLLSVPLDCQEDVRHALGLQELKFNFTKTGSKVILNTQP